MPRDDFLPDPDRASLRMENDLLQYEVLHLRGRVEELRREIGAMPDVTHEDVARLRSAEKDLVWLLQRLDAPPVGWLVRTRSGFRNLWSRWIEGAE